MFIERSEARIRFMRTLFVLLGILPCAGLCGWAVVRHSNVHRDAIERRCEQVIGLPFRIGRVEHVRPNAMRLHDCQLSSASGMVVMSAPVIEVETLPREIRITLGRIDCPPALARVLAELAGAWLQQPVRFPADCVVDVDDFSWRTRAPNGGAGSQSQTPARAASLSHGLHVECVAANGSRAVRVRRNAEGSAPDEVRIVAGSLGAAAEPGAVRQESGSPQPDQGDARRLQISGTVAEPLPIGVLEAVCGLEPGSLPLGDEATVSGTVAAMFDGGISSGTGQAQFERIDLASASLHLPHRVSGEAMVAIDKLEWSRGRITACECQGSVSRGRVGQRLLDACVSVLGCRPGPAYRSLARDEVRSFDDMAALLRIGASGAELRANSGRDGALARVQGLSIVDEPPGMVPLERLAWLLSPPGVPAVPASRATAWLLGWFAVDAPKAAALPLRVGPATPAGGQAAGDVPGTSRDQAARSLPRSEF